MSAEVLALDEPRSRCVRAEPDRDARHVRAAEVQPVGVTVPAPALPVRGCRPIQAVEYDDGVPEVKDGWRDLRDTLFNSGGVVEGIRKQQLESSTTTAADGSPAEGATKASGGDEDEKVNRVGSKSASSYDRLSVICEPVDREVVDAEGCEELYGTRAVQALPVPRGLVQATLVDLVAVRLP